MNINHNLDIHKEKENNNNNNFNSINLEKDSPKKIPLEKQIDSKDWNIRKNCYQNIMKNLEIEKFQEILNSQIYSKTNENLLNYLPKIAEDILPQSLEIGLDLIIRILKIDEEDDNHLIDEESKFNIMKSIIDKAIFSIKSSCKEKSKEIIMILFEFNLNLINRYMDLFANIFDSNKPKVNIKII
jgi:hypothetical protein